MSVLNLFLERLKKPRNIFFGNKKYNNIFECAELKLTIDCFSSFYNLQDLKPDIFCDQSGHHISFLKPKNKLDLQKRELDIKKLPIRIMDSYQEHQIL